MLTALRILGSLGTGLGLLWMAISLIRVARAYPPPPPFAYGALVSALLPPAIAFLCGAARLLLGQDNAWLTALVVVALAVAAFNSLRAAWRMHRRVPMLIQVNRDVTRLQAVVSEAAPKAEPT